MWVVGDLELGTAGAYVGFRPRINTGGRNGNVYVRSSDFPST